jgi:glycosyltransferase involved in cell wall biosynthesis
VGFVNPEPIKGVSVFARIVEQVSKRRPEIPFLVVNSRQRGDLVVEVGRIAGLDLTQANLMVAEPVARPAALYAVIRVLLVPSINEGAGRVAAEALLNGIPVLVSDRGGLPETVGDPAFVIPLPPGTSARDPTPPSAAAVREWVDAVIRLMCDENEYRTASERALRAARTYDVAALIRAYDEFFRELLQVPAISQTLAR